MFVRFDQGLGRSASTGKAHSSIPEEHDWTTLVHWRETDAGQAGDRALSGAYDKVGDVVRRARRPDEHIYGELRRLSSELPEGSRAKTIIDRWWDLAEERRRNAPAPPNFETFSDWPEE
jgi:hypothetical protein